MTVAPTPVTGQSKDQRRGHSFDRDQAVELGATALGAALVDWIPFHLSGWNAPFGALVSWFVLFTLSYATVVRQRHGLLVLKDRLATLLIFAGAGIALVPLGLVLGFVLVKGASVVFNGFPRFPFIRQDLRHFAPNDPIAKAGMQQAMIGTLEQVGLATIFTVPVGVLAATYLNEVGGKFAHIVRTVADAMTGLPTVIAGLFVYSAWVKPHKTNGFSGAAAAMALGVVMLPTIVRTAEEVLRIVSNGLREAALALGAPEWRMVLRVVIPTARTGLVTAAILGVARAVGETAPVLLTAFGSPRTNWSPVNGPQDDLPLRIYQLVRSPSAGNVRVAWGGALLLIVIILTLFTLARIIGVGGAKGGSGGGVQRGRLARDRRPR